MTGPTWGALICGAFTLFVGLWALVRCATRPSYAFEAADKNKAFWTLVLLVALFLPIIGIFIAIGYLFSTDRKVGYQQKLGPGIGFPGYP